MRENMLPLLPKLTETEIKLIKEAIRRYDPDLYEFILVSASTDRERASPQVRFSRAHNKAGLTARPGVIPRPWRGRWHC